MSRNDVCKTIANFISEERDTGTVVYREFIDTLESEGLLDEGIKTQIQNIIRQEMSHRREFEDIAKKIGCPYNKTR